MFAVLAVLLGLWRLFHACLFDAFVKKKRLAGCYVSIPRIAPPELSVLRAFCGHPTTLVHLNVCAFSSGDAGTGACGAALFSYCITYWLCYDFRGEYAGAARPKPAPKSHGLSGLSSAAAGWAIANSKHRKKLHARTAAATPAILGYFAVICWRWFT